MKITNIKIRKVKNDTGNLKAVASIVIDNAFEIHDIRISDGIKGLFIGFPSRKFDDGKFKDIVHPINQETRIMMQDMILTKYKEVGEQ